MKRVRYQKGNKDEYKYMKRCPPYSQRDIANWNHKLTVFHLWFAKVEGLVTPLEKGHGGGRVCELAQPPGAEWLVSRLMAGTFFDQHLSDTYPICVAT